MMKRAVLDVRSILPTRRAGTTPRGVARWLVSLGLCGSIALAASCGGGTPGDDPMKPNPGGEDECADADGDGYGNGVGCLGSDCSEAVDDCWEGSCCEDVVCADADADGHGDGADCLGADCDDDDAECWEGECCPQPPIDDVPGGPPGTAPIVGCEQADRPARRDEAVTEVCEAVGTGQCWYVSPEGSDGNEGTFASPFGTPQAAVRQASAGDVIYLRGGVYDDTHAHDVQPNSWNDPGQGTTRGFISIRRIMLPEWAGGDDYSVAIGTPEAPIVVRSFPGERACATGAGSILVGSGGPSQEVAHWQIEGITLHQGAIIVAGGAQGDDGQPDRQVHDISIRYNEVFEYSRPGTNNPGLVKVDRGNWGGPYDITVESNILHDILPIDDGVVHDWKTTTDSQHFGAISMLSCERYVDPNCVGNGALTIVNNHIYHVPQALYLKTPAAGPFLVQGNVIHDIGSLGGWVPSNITFEDNLVYAFSGGAGVGGAGKNYDKNGHNLVFRDNTLIGVDEVVSFREYASGHTISGNVFEGLSLSVSDGGWNDMGYIAQTISPDVPDTATDIASSQLAMGNDFDNNCFVTPTQNMLAFARRYDAGQGTELSYMSLAEAQSQLGHEVGSDRIDSPAGVFADFGGADYRIDSAGPCAGRGASVPDWAP